MSMVKKRAAKRPARLLVELMKRFDEVEFPAPLDWTRVDGQRLVMTPSGQCVKENLEGKLLTPKPEYYIVGRDGHRLTRDKREQPKQQSERLAKVMTVDRAVVVGSKRVLHTEPVTKRHCAVVVQDGAFVKPKNLFVCYESQPGKLTFRKVLGTCKPGGRP